MAKNTRIAFFVVCDIVCFNASYLLAYLVGSTLGTTEAMASAVASGSAAGPAAASAYFAAYPTGFLILIAVKLLAMYVFSVYRIMFEYAGARDFQRVALSLAASTLASVTASVLIGIEPALVTGVIVFSFIFDMVFVMAVRLLYVRQTGSRGEREAADDGNQLSLRRRYAPQRKSSGRVMVIGVGPEAADLIAEMQENESAGRKAEIIIDDEKTHDGDMLLGVDVVAGRSEIRLRARRQSIDEIIIAKPAAGKRQIAALLRECVKTRCRISILPFAKQGNTPGAAAVAIAAFVGAGAGAGGGAGTGTGAGAGTGPGAGTGTGAASASLADLRSPTVSDLLGRDRPRVDHREIGDHLKGRVILVTGGAGVFGSELCRRIIRYRPRRLIALDASEDGLAMLAAELEGYHTAETEFRTVVASVRDASMMRRAFGAFRPHIVFHAAELKQIPLAQTNPRETFLTNVLGLKTACDLADEFSAEKFILCSTVRAAEPMNVAAECKRTAELYITEKNEKSQTTYAAVRFPNLIEGAGNVISVFTEQIKHGGPLTVTDKDIVRRFISAEESALLTVRAAAIAAGGEIFEIGPGEAIGIRELAEAMIRLTGKIPYEEIDIVVTQLRPGERLFEETGDDGPRSVSPSAERIWVTEDSSGMKLPHWSQLWCQEPDKMDDASVMEILHLIFPTYKNRKAGPTIRGEKIENE